jgi:hypothetical protein
MSKSIFEIREGKTKSEAVDELDELTAAEKKLIDQMYDKKGNLTPMGKKVMDHGKANQKSKRNEEVESTLDEAPRRKGAPKITGDSIAMQRAKDAEHNKAMGRTKTGRKKPTRTMTSTQRSLAQIRGEEVEVNEGIEQTMIRMLHTKFQELSKIADPKSATAKKISSKLGTRSEFVQIKRHMDKIEDILRELDSMASITESVDLEEAKEPASPDEGSMATRQLEFMSDAIEDIIEHIEEGGDFPEWMQNKLTEAHTKIKDLYASVEGSEEEVDESTKAYGKSQEKMRDKKKNDAITPKDKATLGKIAALLAKEKR